jgi:subtilisin family serine protease
VAAAGLLITVRLSSANADPVLSSALQIAKSERVAALMLEAEEQGPLRIIVQLNVPPIPEGVLAHALQAYSHRSAIADAQHKLGSQLVSPQSAIVRNFKNLPLSVLRVSAADLEALASNPLVMSLQEDVPDPLSLDGSIPLIGADTAWASGYTGSGQHLAILDTGVDSSHEFLTGKVVAEACFSTTDAGVASTTLCPSGGESEIGVGAAVNCSIAITGCDHGTHVAGIAAGTGASFSGVAKGADIIAVQVFSRFNTDANCGAGNSPCILSFLSDQIAGLDWVYSQSGTYAIASANMSLGGGNYSSNCDTDLRKTYVDQLRSVGIATVISSGNNGYTSAMGAPACISTAISVGSTTSSNTVSSFSNIASFISLLAPGSSIYSSVPGDAYSFKSGTSMAAPHVTGAWAVLKSKDPGASVNAILTALTSTGASINDSRSGGSVTGMARIQVDSAIAALPSPTPTPTATVASPTVAPTSTTLPPTDTPLPPTNTPLPPTVTPLPPTATPLLPTNTPLPPTNTPVPPTNTPLPPTYTPPPPTNTPLPPTSTPLPPTNTPPPPTDTPLPPTATSSPAMADLNLDGGVDVLDVQLCVNVFLGTETDPGIVSRSDVNSDSSVDVLDVQLVVNVFLGG